LQQGGTETGSREEERRDEIKKEKTETCSIASRADRRPRFSFPIKSVKHIILLSTTQKPDNETGIKSQSFEILAVPIPTKLAFVKGKIECTCNWQAKK